MGWAGRNRLLLVVELTTSILYFLPLFFTYFSVYTYLVLPAIILLGREYKNEVEKITKRHLETNVSLEKTVGYYNTLIFTTIMLYLFSILSSLYALKLNVYQKAGILIFLCVLGYLALNFSTVVAKLFIVSTSLYAPYLFSVLMAGYTQLSPVLLLGGFIRVMLWFGIEAALLKSIVLVKSELRLNIHRLFNFMPLAFGGLLILFVRLLDYFVPVNLLYYRKIFEQITLIMAWGLSYYLLGKKINEQIDNAPLAYSFSILIGIITFVLLPPPL
ncbi:hypothetical protein ADU37_CDS17810 [Thermococcus sp. 2319x1]|uniref:hypothetical protein n=1 Tax=Thermococcus sp. 2319x1 TaxID=1674923 RepID=UPI00073AAD5A|nr:hypothetical protein [Thermococcus sp. 2319x1]ALV63480.1 hypothetical protein ADU37_CDS17810 [Thermococcus sp. 2319x1]